MLQAAIATLSESFSKIHNFFLFFNAL